MSLMPSIDMTANWIADWNRFNLPKPPTWFLRALWDQDAALVVLPSRQGRKYLLARRRSHSLTAARIVQNVITGKRLESQSRYSDSDMLASLHLVLVDTITSLVGNVASGSWMRSAPAMLSDLRKRDMWSAGGADAYIAQIETTEQSIADKKRARLLDDMDHRAGDAWRSYQARTGQRTRATDTGMSRTSRAKIVQVGTL